MSDKAFQLSRFSPAIQEMCRLEYHFRSCGDPTEPIDYIERFSLTNDDITALLEIAGWLGQDKNMSDYKDAPLHAWEALSLLDPILVVPQMLDILNRIDWDEADHVLDLLWDILAFLGVRSATETQETGNTSLDTIPLFMSALKEKERHSTTRMILSFAVNNVVHKFPEYSTEYHQILLNELKELQIGYRDWYATAVCELAFVENPTPELATLINKACREGYAETGRYYGNGGLEETFGFDFDNDPELIVLHEKSRITSDVIRAFRDCKNKFPHQAVKQARELRDWIIPNLIEVVRDATAYARFKVANDDGTAQFAVHLLAEFQAKEALPAVLDSLSLPSDNLWDHMYGEGLYEAMPGILNRLIGDDPEFYDQQLRDPQAPETLQICLSESLRYLVARKVISVETYGSWLRDYLEIAIQGEKKELVPGLVNDIVDTANPDYIPIIRSAFEKNLVDPMEFEYAEDELKSQIPIDMSVFPDPTRDFSDAVEELSDWAWFQEDEYEDSDYHVLSKNLSLPSIDIARALFGNERGMTMDDWGEDEYDDEVLAPLKTGQKIGRNDPCPCGSGKKYKVCCLKK